MEELIIIGGGLAGCEAAFQAARRGIKVKLYEMRPFVQTQAHKTDNLAEIVCSNSLGSLLPDRASGLLNKELQELGSMLISAASKAAVPAGGSLAVDREVFSETVMEELAKISNIEIIRKEIQEIPSNPTIICSGPLTSSKLTASIQKFTGLDQLYFFDAIAPIVYRNSIDMTIAYEASRFGNSKGQTDDYINCPFTKSEYDHFIYELLNAERVQLKDIDSEPIRNIARSAKTFFEGCLPVEEIARRGQKSLTFGPMRPIGLIDPRSDSRPYAVLQLRQDNVSGSLFNMVGFQTNLKHSEQTRVFHMVPGLQNCEFVRFGQMHRNTYISSPVLLKQTFQSNKRIDLFFAGQITGIEGYLGNIGSGLLAGANAANLLNGLDMVTLPRGTMLGSLCYYVTHCSPDNFKPMKANFGILPELDSQIRTRLERTAQHVNNAENAMNGFLQENKLLI